MFKQHMTTGLEILRYQLDLHSFLWESGRVKMVLKLFPANASNNSIEFNLSEVRRIMDKFTTWSIPHSDLFGPFELLPSVYIDGLSRNHI
jgi:hypothetical protein